MRIIAAIVLFALTGPIALAQDDWFCTEGASERKGDIILACGIAKDGDEDVARKSALSHAFDELDLVCDRSADCRKYELNIEPQRNECISEGGAYKCYRAILATITSERREEKFRKGVTLQPQMTALEHILDINLELTRLKLEHSNENDSTGPEAVEGCGADTTRLDRALADLATSEKQDAMAKAAIEIPIEGDCWANHFRVLDLLRRYQLTIDRYDEFLLQTIGKTQTPGHENRLSDILYYYNALGAAGEKWPIILDGLKRSNILTHDLLSRTIGRDFHNRVPREEQRQRFEQLLQSATAGELGRPVPLKFDKVFVHLLQAASPTQSRRYSWLVVDACERHFNQLSGETDDFSEVHRVLFSAYKYAETDEERRAAIKWIAANVNRAGASIDMGMKLVAMFTWLQKEMKDLDDERSADRAIIERYQNDLAEFKRLAKGNLEASLGMLPDGYDPGKRVAFCMENGIECANIMPEVDKLRRRLNSRHEKKRIAALEIIARSPAAAKRLEGEIIEMMHNYYPPGRGYDNKQTRMAINALMAIPTEDPRALDFILERVLKWEVDHERIARGIGPRLVGRVMAVVSDRNYSNHHRRTAVLFLGLVGPAAKETVPLLKAEREKDDNDMHIKQELRKSLLAIEG